MCLLFGVTWPLTWSRKFRYYSVTCPMPTIYRRNTWNWFLCTSAQVRCSWMRACTRHTSFLLYVTRAKQLCSISSLPLFICWLRIFVCRSCSQSAGSSFQIVQDEFTERTYASNFPCSRESTIFELRNKELLILIHENLPLGFLFS